MIDITKLVSRVTYNGQNIPLDLSGLRTEIIEGEWEHISPRGDVVTVYTFKADGTGVYNVYTNKEHEGVSHPITYTNTDARLFITFDDTTTLELIYTFIDTRCQLKTEDESYFLYKRTNPIKVGKKTVDQNMKTYYAKDEGLDGFTELTVQIQATGEYTDLDVIKYHDNMIEIESGRIPPTDEEYNEILTRGYKILDLVFRGE